MQPWTQQIHFQDKYFFSMQHDTVTILSRHFATVRVEAY
jgi:hypothetical protein